MSARPQWGTFFSPASSHAALWAVCVFTLWRVNIKPHEFSVWLVQQTDRRRRKRRLIESVLGSVWVNSSHLAMWGDERQPAVGAKGPLHRSIPLSSDLRVYPAHHGDWGTSFSLIQPARTAPSSNVTGWKDVYVFQDFGRRGRGCAERERERERERGNRDGAKGEGVPGRALTAAPASCGSAFHGKKYWLYSRRGSVTLSRFTFFPLNVDVQWSLKNVTWIWLLCSIYERWSSAGSRYGTWCYQEERKQFLKKLLNGTSMGNIRNISSKWINCTQVSEVQLLQKMTHGKRNK